MSDSRHHPDPCGICSFLGTYVPWGMIVTGGIIGGMPGWESWGETSAYLLAMGLSLLAVSYLLARLKPTRP